jgi:hypothetical protein
LPEKQRDLEQAQSTAQNVLNLEDAATAVIWNDLPGRVRTLQSIRSLRANMSHKLGIAPQYPHSEDPFTDYTDYTVCFVHPDTGITAGPITVYPNNAAGRSDFRSPLAEWLTLAAMTRRGGIGCPMRRRPGSWPGR